MKEITPAAEKRGRLLYIIEADLEYLISILVASSFLATLTKEIGLSDGLTGILSSIISLGCLFQLLSVFIRPKRDKFLVTVFSVINQLLFMTLYIIPLLNISSSLKAIIFVVCIILAYFVYYLVHPKKINWFMSLVDDLHRGTFTANKEIISLISGMFFSFLMGFLTDHFKEVGKIKITFIIFSVVIFVIMVCHTLTMVFTVEKTIESSQKKKLSTCLKEIFKNKTLLVITGVFVLYQISHGISFPFYGTYTITELGFSLKFISLVTMLGSVVRIIFSRFLGNYADKKSFAAMIEICLISLALAYLSMGFAVASSGKIMFILYHIFYGFAMGGINSALTNMIFDYVPHEKRSDSLAVCQAISGLCGFLATLLMSTLVTNIQNNGNVFLGMNLYAQQVFSFISVIIAVITIIYVRKVIIKRQVK